MNTPLRDQRIGRLLAARGCNALKQAERGGTQLDNVVRMAEWRIKYANVPLEQTLPNNTPKRLPASLGSRFFKDQQ